MEERGQSTGSETIEIGTERRLDLEARIATLIAKMMEQLVAGWDGEPDRVSPPVITDERLRGKLIASHVSCPFFVPNGRIPGEPRDGDFATPPVHPREFPEQRAGDVSEAVRIGRHGRVGDALVVEQT